MAAVISARLRVRGAGPKLADHRSLVVWPLFHAPPIGQEIAAFEALQVELDLGCSLADDAVALELLLVVIDRSDGDRYERVVLGFAITGVECSALVLAVFLVVELGNARVEAQHGWHR